ncbi:hypothetical protein SDC9_203741 [bioreactor metagenome]|uniref:Uncharacterized protein n=1 Tax=bioreactor metagenome TaxID=1076179 RepID=A0A645IX98_9ZZZZ
MTVFVDPFGVQPGIHDVAYAHIKDGKGGHAQQHADEPKQAAAYYNGHQHPNSGKPGAVPQNFGAQDIPVKLLQRDDQNEKFKRAERIHDQQDQRTGNGADQRPEERDHVGHAHDHADQYAGPDPYDLRQEKA